MTPDKLDGLARDLPDPDECTEPRDEHVLAALRAAVPRVITSLVLQEEAKGEAELVLARADAAWRQAQDEQAFKLMIEHDVFDEWMPDA